MKRNLRDIAGRVSKDIAGRVSKDIAGPVSKDWLAGADNPASLHIYKG
jgi:hypothetical protein